MIIGSGGASRPSVSQNSNDGIGGGSGGAAKGLLVMLGLLAAFFLYLYLLG